MNNLQYLYEISCAISLYGVNATNQLRGLVGKVTGVPRRESRVRNYLSIVGLELIHVGKKGPSMIHTYDLNYRSRLPTATPLSVSFVFGIDKSHSPI